MRFPEHAREGSHAHDDALHRVDEARNRQRDLNDALDASATTSEIAAATQRSVAGEKVLASEAWLSWVERGY